MSSSFRPAALAAVALVLACSDNAASTHSAAAGVGACCGDAATCPQSTCGAGLHCGASQTPRPVGICCAEGSVCCILDADCQRDAHGAVCDKATFTCACAGDDARCGAGYHCAGNACVAGVADGGACSRSRACASGNCSAPFDPAVATSTCAPAGTCAAGAAASYPVGYVLCAGGSGTTRSSRTCAAAGTWSAPATFSGKAACTGVSGYASGATCTSGPDAAVNGLKLACVDCGRYLPAATLDGCRSSCTTLLDCAPGSYCQGRTCVASLTNGSPCLDDRREVHAACQSGRCDGTCMDKLASGARCGEDADCQAGLFCIPSLRDIAGRPLEYACSGGCRDVSDCGDGYTDCTNNECRY